MVLEIIILSKTERQILHVITYMWNLKYNAHELLYETNKLTYIENTLLVVKGEGGRGRDIMGIWYYQM